MSVQVAIRRRGLVIVAMKRLLCGALAAAVGLAPHLAAAQGYKSVKGAITNPRDVLQLQRDVGSILRSDAGLTQADQEKLRSYYLMHVIAGMTQPTSSLPAEQFPKWRKQVVSHLSDLAQSSAKHTYIRNLIYRGAKALASDAGYSPAARYNALLLIGELNDREGASRPLRPPVPMTEARTFLLSVLNSDESQEMKVGALIGLARHARLLAAGGSVPQEDLRNLVGAFRNVLQQTEPSDSGTSDGLMWMQRIAVDGLGDIGHPAAAPMLQPIVSNTSAPLMLRCAAASALGRLDYQQANVAFDAAIAVKGMGQLATEVLGQQLKAIDEHLQTTAGAQGPAVRIGGEGEETNVKQPEDPFVLRVRRELKYPLESASHGLTALEGITTDSNAKTAATDVRSAVDAILKQLDTAQLTPQTLREKIAQPALQLENAVNRLQ